MSDSKIACLQCNITFSKKSSLLRHQRKFHPQDVDIACHQICGACEEKFRTIFDIHNHIQKEHTHIKLEFNEEIFYCQSDFEKWKTEIEHKTVSFYVLQYEKKDENMVVSQYRCNRSGPLNLRKKTERMRRMKVKGSIKIGVTCPAMMKVTKQFLDEATQIHVSYQSTHIGHECEVDKLPLQKEVRSNIADMLSAGVPTSAILNKIKEQYSPTKKLKQLTRQDLYNVARDFNIKVPHIDAKSVGNEVCKMVDNDYSSILVVYKPQEEQVDQYQNIKKENFSLGNRTEAQMDLCNKYTIPKEKGNSNSSLCADEESLVINVSENEAAQKEERNVILKQIHKKPRIELDHEVEELKSEVEELLQSISRKIHTTESLNDIIYVRDHLKAICAYLDSTTKPSELQIAKIPKTFLPPKKLYLKKKKKCSKP